MKENLKKININSYEEFITLLKTNHQFKKCIFRGQQNINWDLKATFYRDIETQENFQILMNRHLEKFKIFVRGRIDNLQSMTDDEIWCIGQHYGLSTPLLDWTASPFIGLFFAFTNPNISKEDHVLYILDTSLINFNLHMMVGTFSQIIPKYKSMFDNLVKNNTGKFSKAECAVLLGNKIYKDIDNQNNYLQEIKTLKAKIEEMKVRIINPKIDNNPRLLSQRGLFTKMNSTKTLVELVENDQWKTDKTILTIVTIPDKIIEDVRKNLNSMNINYLSLFPDLQGTSLYCNEKLKEENILNEDHINKLEIENVWI